MPSHKGWFAVSQDINHDREFRDYAKKFGLAGVRLWLELLSNLCRSHNKMCLHKHFDLGLLSSSCGTKPKIILTSYQHLLDINWISVGVDVDMNMYIYAPKWLKYNRLRKHNFDNVAPISSELVPLHKHKHIHKQKEKNYKNNSKRKCGWPEGFVLTPVMMEYAKKHGIENPAEEFEKFRDHAEAKGYKYLDWEKAWQNWCRSPYQDSTRVKVKEKPKFAY